jgi:hypothetical protein
VSLNFGSAIKIANEIAAQPDAPGEFPKGHLKFIL